MSLVAPLTWFLCIVIQSRCELILYGADDMVRLLFFWSLFLPLDGAFTLFRKTPFLPCRYFSVATIGILLQVVFFYFYAAVAKTGLEWRTEGTAIFHALVNDQFATDFGKSLTHHTSLLRVATFSVLAMEFASPLLLLCTVWRRRQIAVSLFIFFHISIALTLNLGIVPLVNVVALILFLPLNSSRQLPVSTLPTLNGRQWLSASVIIYLIAWNSFQWSGAPKTAIQWPAYLLRIDQDWRFYAPAPSRSAGWWNFPAELVDGSQVDAWTGGSLSADIPRPFIRQYGAHWMTYLFQSRLQVNAPQRILLLRFFCRKDPRFVSVKYQYSEGTLTDLTSSQKKIYNLEQVICPKQL